MQTPAWTCDIDKVEEGIFGIGEPAEAFVVVHELRLDFRRDGIGWQEVGQSVHGRSEGGRFVRVVALKQVEQEIEGFQMVLVGEGELPLRRGEIAGFLEQSDDEKATHVGILGGPGAEDASEDFGGRQPEEGGAIGAGNGLELMVEFPGGGLGLLARAEVMELGERASELFDQT